jgi:hypothetical protein
MIKLVPDDNIYSQMITLAPDDNISSQMITLALDVNISFQIITFSPSTTAISSPPTLSNLGKQASTHTSTPFYCILGCGLLASVRTFGDNAEGQTEVRIKHVFIAVCEVPWLLRKPHSKFSMAW